MGDLEVGRQFSDLDLNRGSVSIRIVVQRACRAVVDHIIIPIQRLRTDPELAGPQSAIRRGRERESQIDSVVIRVEVRNRVNPASTDRLAIEYEGIPAAAARQDVVTVAAVNGVVAGPSFDDVIP